MVSPGAAEFSGKPVFNARIETVATIGLFKQPFLNSRCIVPALGYYEWQLREDGKQPFFIREKGGPMAMAGVVRAWRNKAVPETDPDAWRLSMSIVTLDAHVTPGEVHDRMPAFLTPEVYDDWLGEGLGAEELTGLLMRASNEVAEDLEFYEVSRAVNASVVKGQPNNSAAFIEPLTPPD
jgi:putative SOS response-associated peptidase YedK